ncbi:CapA family protein [Streptomyces puniciscabiei]|uniref:CapA family protein n=1 Tax=Streptomyces puniciscabiei TaxID=164348 RepID=UPI00332CB8D2
MTGRRSRTLLSLLTPLSLLAAVSGCGLLSGGAGAQGGRRSFTVAAAGDILMHPELVDQARRDAKRTGKGVDGMDFGPMMAGIKPLISKADLAICHFEPVMASSRSPGGSPGTPASTWSSAITRTSWSRWRRSTGPGSATASATRSPGASSPPV